MRGTRIPMSRRKPVVGSGAGVGESTTNQLGSDVRAAGAADTAEISEKSLSGAFKVEDKGYIYLDSLSIPSLYKQFLVPV